MNDSFVLRLLWALVLGASLAGLATVGRIFVFSGENRDVIGISFSTRLRVREAARSALVEACSALRRCCFRDGPFAAGADFPRVDWKSRLTGENDALPGTEDEDRYYPSVTRNSFRDLNFSKVVICHKETRQRGRSLKQGFLLFESTVSSVRPLPVKATIRHRYRYRVEHGVVFIDEYPYASCIDWILGGP